MKVHQFTTCEIDPSLWQARFGWRGYLGVKAYGADSPEYLNWMPAEDVYESSQAIQFSGRLRISD